MYMTHGTLPLPALTVFHGEICRIRNRDNEPTHRHELPYVDEPPCTSPAWNWSHALLIALAPGDNCVGEEGEAHTPKLSYNCMERKYFRKNFVKFEL